MAHGESAVVTALGSIEGSAVKPVISVVTVTNRPHNLETLAEELLKQDFAGSVEHVIILDGKTMSAGEVERLLQVYRDSGKDIKVQIHAREAEPGRYLFERLGAMRNAGARRSSGDYLAFWDDDNQFEPNHLSTLYAAASTLDMEAAHSLRTMWNADGRPYKVEEGKYPWITTDPKRSKIMFDLQVTEGILRAGTTVIYDKFAYGEGNKDCCVDTNEWLISHAIFDAVGGFSEKMSAAQIAFGYTDDHILGLRLVDKGAHVACTGEPTLRYFLGGNSQNAYLALADTAAPVPDAAKAGPLEVAAWAGVDAPDRAAFFHALAARVDARDLLVALGQIKPTDRTWLWSETPASTIGGTWSAPARGAEGAPLSLFRESPKACVLSADEQARITERFYAIDWAALGAKLEPMIRAKLGLPVTMPMSVIPFGSFVTKADGMPGDIDFAIVIEDPTDKRVNVGSPLLSIPVAEINDYMPDGFKFAGDKTHLDVSVVGRGALLDPTCHSGDLSNLAVWGRLNGVCVKGHHLVRHVDDHLLLQEYFVTLGFTYKHMAEDGREINPKRLGALHNGVNTLLFLADKYEMPAAFKGAITEFAAHLSGFERSGRPLTRAVFAGLEEQCSDLVHQMHAAVVAKLQGSLAAHLNVGVVTTVGAAAVGAAAVHVGPFNAHHAGGTPAGSPIHEGHAAAMTVSPRM